MLGEFITDYLLLRAGSYEGSRARKHRGVSCEDEACSAAAVCLEHYNVRQRSGKTSIVCTLFTLRRHIMLC